jgi:hypothetical protein
MALCLFTLLSCGKSDTLFDILSESVASEEGLPCGSILVYGRNYDNPISDDTLINILGVSSYRDFIDKIEDFALFSSLSGDYMEVALIRLYKVGDTRTAKLLFERRIEEAKRALTVSRKEGYAKYGFVEIKGNCVALYMLPEDSKIIEKVKKRI